MKMSRTVRRKAPARCVPLLWLVLLLLLGCSPASPSTRAAVSAGPPPTTVASPAGDWPEAEPRKIGFGVRSMGMTAFAIHVAGSRGMFGQRNLDASMVEMKSSSLPAAGVGAALGLH